MYKHLTTLAQVATEKAALRSLLEANNPETNLDEIESKMQHLETRETELRTAAEQQEKRSRLMQKIASGEADGKSLGNPVNEPTEERSISDILASKEYRSAWAKTLLRRKLNEAERRALDTVVTTTATEFVEASESADGVNNGGYFIPTELNLALMQELSLVSPIFRDINKTSFQGVLKFPYKKSKNKAERKGANKETEANKDGAIEWAMLELKAAEITVTIPVTWKLEAMAVDQFMSFFLTELKLQISEAKIEGAIYGTGEDDMEGITVNAITKTYSGTVLDALKAHLSALDAKKKIGAKLYISTTAAEELQFAQDSNKAYIFPIAAGLPKTLAGYTLEVEPYLHDGDIVLGNLQRYARMNTVEAMSVTKDVSGKKRRNDYTAYELCASAAQPDTILYLKKGTQG